jgi:HEAT repeat protein
MADSSVVPRLSLLFSLLALAVASVAVAGSWRAQRRGPAAAAAIVDTEDLERRMTDLERQLELVRVGVAVRGVAQGKGPAAAQAAEAPVPAGTAELAQRVAALERLAAEVTQRRQGGNPLSPEALAAATRTLLDRQAPVDERAAALTLLRPNEGRSDGRTHEVVVAALELLERPEVPPKTRAGMIRDLDKLKDPSLKDPLVAILTRDADGRTRREAVETLAVFYDDPQVRGLVERLRDSDPEPQVRAQAVKQLGRWQARGGQ